MPIKVICPACQQALVAKDEHSGRSCNCPKCKQPLTIPTAAASATVATAIRREAAPAAAPASQSPPQSVDPPCPSCKQPFPPDKVVCVECGYSRRLKRRMKTKREEPATVSKPSTWTKAAPAPAKVKSTKPRKPIFSVDGGKMLGGLGMMAGAALWFGLGWMAGRIFFYPPVLFVLGFVAFINGLFGEDGTW